VASYNWTLLDELLDMVAGEHKLRIGFEIMGNPRTTPSSRTGVYTSWKATEQLVLILSSFLCLGFSGCVLTQIYKNDENA